MTKLTTEPELAQKTNLTEFRGSGRALARLESPLFASDSVEAYAFLEQEVPGTFSIEFDAPGKEAVLLYGLLDKNQPDTPVLEMKYVSAMQGEKLAFFDVAIELLRGRNVQQLKQLDIREVENFLRDRNDQAAFRAPLVSFYPLFTELIKALDKAIQASAGRRTGEKRSPNLSEDYCPGKRPLIRESTDESFTDLSKLEQMNLVYAVLDKFVRPALYLDYGDVDCLFIDDVMIVVEFQGECATCQRSLTSTMDYLQAVLRLELEVPELLVVTDS